MSIEFCLDYGMCIIFWNQMQYCLNENNHTSYIYPETEVGEKVFKKGEGCLWLSSCFANLFTHTSALKQRSTNLLSPNLPPHPHLLLNISRTCKSNIFLCSKDWTKKIISWTKQYCVSPYKSLWRYEKHSS